MWDLIAGTGTIFSEIGGVFADLFSGSEPDFNMLKRALRADAAWLWGAIMTILGGLLVALLYRTVPIVERHLEPTLMVVSYLTMGGIIFVEVLRDVIYSVQVPWATTIPGYLFLIMAWTGCSYNVRLRTHLSFSEFRSKMPRGIQFALLTLDAVLWWGICWIVIVTSSFVVANSADNYGLISGTDWFTWWFIVIVPIAFILLSARVFQNLFDDAKNFRDGSPMIEPTVLGGQ